MTDAHTVNGSVASTDTLERVRHLTVELDLTSMSINWTPYVSTFSFQAKWVCKTGAENCAHGELTLDLQCKGMKPKQVRLKGIVGESYTPQERQHMALEIKKQLREQVRYMADKAYRALHTQSIGVW